MDMTIVIFLCIIGAAKWSAMPKVNNTRLANRIELPERAKSDMATPKIKTLQTRFGFADTDLKNPVHDDIIKWLDDNIEDVLATVFQSSRPEGVRVKWEPLVRMSEEGGQFIGFADLAAYQVNHDGFVLFEAKTKIDSLGELFRQLRLYEEGFVFGQRVSRKKFVVVCPDDSDAELIREQGFRFLKYNPSMVFPNKV